MGRARIRAILAALRRPGAGQPRPVPAALLRQALAGLLLIALLLSNAAVLPATAAQGPPGGLSGDSSQPLQPSAAEAQADTARAGSLPPAVQALPTVKDRQPAERIAAAGATVTDGAASVPAPPDRPSWPLPATTSSPELPALLAPTSPSPPAAASERQVFPAVDSEPLAPTSPLERRLRRWPDWTLPAPLARPGRRAPPWPIWFSGEWLVESETLPTDPTGPPQSNPPWRARFRDDGRGSAVAERACNAFAVGRILLGERLLSVQDDPANPQRQLARLAGDRLLETSLIGQRGETPEPERFLNDELSLEVLHGPGEPRVSRIETLGRWRLLADGSIAGEQWQARYPSPSEGLAAPARSTDHWRLRLVPVPPGSGRATETKAPARGCR